MVNQPLLDVFPNEITTEIITLCDLSTQAALCRVCKFFQQLAVPWLYRIVELDDLPPSKVGITTTIYGFDTSAVNQQYTTFLSIKTHLPPEETDDSLNPRTIGSTWTFWFLFINRHPAISHLALPWDCPYAFPPIKLPNLAIYSGFQTSLLTLGKTDKLRTVKLGIYPGRDNQLHGLDRFPTCQEVSIMISSIPTDVEFMRQVLGDLKKRLPWLKSLMLVYIGVHTRFRLGQVLDTVLAEELAGFKELEAFGISVYDDMNHPDYHAPIIASWIKHRPTLREASIFLRGLRDPEGRYKIVDGKVEPTTEPCRMEKAFDNMKACDVRLLLR
ncbi:hypothetical protein C8J56DRAFT_1111513 [Mycena floridula]|nr:hypothetical protein C8J56DRAFT_1111513 [Mycena floridula]